MNKMTRTAQLTLGTALLAGIWAIANAGPIRPPSEGVAPTPEALDAINLKVDRIIDELGGTAPDPAPGLSAYISMINGEAQMGRVAIDHFSYEIDSPFQTIPGGGGFTRTSLGEISIGMEEIDAAFVPFMFTSLSGQTIDSVVIDLCTFGGQMPTQESCAMTLELFDVRIVRGGALGGGLEHSYELTARRIRTTFRTINGQGPPQTHVHGWDYEFGTPF